MVSVSVATMNDPLDPLIEEPPSEYDTDLNKHFVAPVDFEQNPSMIRVDIIKAEGLPQMDYSLPFQKKDTVDPYVRIRLGKLVTDNKQYKVKNNANPEFGQRF